MSVRTLPLVFINLGGEMLYILDQRLRAHNTSEDNSEKGVWSENDRKRVMNDIVGTMFSKAFMDELLKPQQLYSHRTLKAVLTRLAHASIMRLNPASMDRVYSSLSEGEFQLLRQTLLIFFQDMHVRVSLFLKNQVQNPNGRFALTTSGPVPHGIDVPGLIRTFDRKGREVRRSEFPTGGSYTSPIREGSFELHGDRVIRLGLNIYTVNHPEETHTSKAPSVKCNLGMRPYFYSGITFLCTSILLQKHDTPNLLAKEELNLMARLMGSMKAENMPKAETGLRINLFTTDQEEEEAEASGGAEESLFGVINIQAMQDEQAATALARIAGQFAEQEEQPENPSSNKGDDLLAMMDNL
ncbi:protein OSCP1a isoform X6 [Siniperca chuatsi]|uniref:protein OSCP1a isoform X6 n=1 Tax=Siniperca chuatsi TaxID=119488 RepID=UPI001CE1D4D2|nr:protein OSCP1a isoform X6 [Siniperca chuatsi]